MLLRKFWIAVAAAAMTVPAAVAQTAVTSAPATDAPPQLSAAAPDGGIPEFVRPETPEQRKERIGTAEDPGLDPDPGKHFWRFGASYHINKYERRLAVYDAHDANYVRPMGMVNFSYEIYQQNQKYIWCWMPDVDMTQTAGAPPAQPAPSARYKEGDIAYFARIRPQFTALTPADSGKTIRFAESSDGLPQNGSWRNSLAVADMNEDHCPDIIVPAERKGGGLPQIFLGDCKGHWQNWSSATLTALSFQAGR